MQGLSKYNFGQSVKYTWLRNSQLSNKYAWTIKILISDSQSCNLTAKLRLTCTKFWITVQQCKTN